MLNSPSTPPERSSTREAVTVDDGLIFSAAPPTEPAGSIPEDRTTDREMLRHAVRAAAEHLRSTHWDGNGCGTNGVSGCSRCYGPSPADADEVAEDVLDVAMPIIASDLGGRLAAVERERDELRAENGRLRERPFWTGRWVQMDLAARWKTERDEARSQLADTQARLEAVKALIEHADVIGDYVHVDTLRAALSVAPQPEPERWTQAEVDSIKREAADLAAKLRAHGWPDVAPEATE